MAGRDLSRDTFRALAPTSSLQAGRATLWRDFTPKQEESTMDSNSSDPRTCQPHRDLGDFLFPKFYTCGFTCPHTLFLSQARYFLKGKQALCFLQWGRSYFLSLSSQPTC